MTTCANGHDSTESDYCSVCGTRIEGAAVAAAPAPAVASAAPDASAGGSAPGELCPNCSTELDPGSRFCEVCGYDPDTGSLPKAPVVQPADPVDAAGDAPADSAAAVADAGAAAPTSAPAPAGGTWIAVVTADRAYYDRNKVTEVQFPLGVPARTITLEPGTSQHIGRRSQSRGTNPEIDLAGPPEDAAVSHTHASLLSKDDGSWELVDHGSTNGTYVNEGPDPVAANTPIPLVSGDRVYVGAWTRITLQQTTPPS